MQKVQYLHISGFEIAGAEVKPAKGCYAFALYAAKDMLRLAVVDAVHARNAISYLLNTQILEHCVIFGFPSLLKYLRVCA